MSKIFYDKDITPWSRDSIQGKLVGLGAVGTYTIQNTIINPTGSMAIFVPFNMLAPATLTQVFWYIGSGTAGFVDVGVYSNAGTLLTHSGNILVSGANSAIQTVDIPDYDIAPGQYFMAFVSNNKTGSFLASQFGNFGLDEMAGIYQQANASPLPARAAFINPVMDYVPIFGLQTRSLV